MARQLSIPLHFVSITHTKGLHALMVSGKNFENTHVIVGLSDHSNEIFKKMSILCVCKSLHTKNVKSV